MRTRADETIALLDQVTEKTVLPPAAAVFTGSRHLKWGDGAFAINYQLRLLPPGSLILHGACPCRWCKSCPCLEHEDHHTISADAIVDRLAPRFGHVVERHPADWSLGRRAGPVRNEAMADRLVAFGRAGVPIVGCALPLDGGTGTAQCMFALNVRGVHVRTWTSL